MIEEEPSQDAAAVDEGDTNSRSDEPRVFVSSLAEFSKTSAGWVSVADVDRMARDGLTPGEYLVRACEERGLDAPTEEEKAQFEASLSRVQEEFAKGIAATLTSITPKLNESFIKTGAQIRESYLRMVKDSLPGLPDGVQALTPDYSTREHRPSFVMPVDPTVARLDALLELLAEQGDATSAESARTRVVAEDSLEVAGRSYGVMSWTLAMSIVGVVIAGLALIVAFAGLT